MAAAQDYHVSTLLTNMSVKLVPMLKDFIGSVVSPVIKVPNETGKILKYTDGYFNSNRATLIPEGGTVDRGEYGTSLVSWSTDEFGWGKAITRRAKGNQDNIYRLEANAMEFVLKAVLMYREVVTATACFDTSTWTNEAIDVGTKWNTADAHPIQNLRYLIKKSRDSMSGTRMPNLLVIGNDPWHYLQESSEVLTFLFGSGSNKALIVTEDILASYLGIERVVVGRLAYNTAEEGLTPVIANVWGDYAWAGWVNQRPAIDDASAMYTLSAEFFTRKWMEEATGSTIVEQIANEDTKVLSSAMGYMLTGLL